MYGSKTTAAEWRPEIRLLVSFEILKTKEVRTFLSDTESFIRKLTAEQATQDEFVKMIERYIYVLDLCKYKFDNDMIPRNLLKYFNAKVIKYLCKCIDDLYYKMVLKFPIEQELLDTYINFSTNFADHKDEADCHTILTAAIETFKYNLDIWILVLMFYVQQNCYEKANNFFQDGIKLFKDKSLPLWDVMNEYLQNNMDNIDMVKQFYIQGVNEPYENISLKYSVEYLKWFQTRPKYRTSNIRDLFKNLISIHPQCKDLYITMINYESSRRHISVVFLRNLYTTLCNEFGHTDVELWNNWMSFEFINGTQSEVKDVYQRSCNVLKTEEICILSLKFNEMCLKYMVHNTNVIDSISDTNVIDTISDTNVIDSNNDTDIIVLDDDPVVIHSDPNANIIDLDDNSNGTDLETELNDGEDNTDLEDELDDDSDTTDSEDDSDSISSEDELEGTDSDDNPSVIGSDDGLDVTFSSNCPNLFDMFDPSVIDVNNPNETILDNEENKLL